MINQIIAHFDWMTEALKQQHDSAGIGGGYSDHLTNAMEVLGRLRYFENGGLITKRTRIDLILLAGALQVGTAANIELSKALLEDLQEDGVKITREDEDG